MIEKKAVSKESGELIEWLTHLITISASGDGDEQGVSFYCLDTIRQYIQVIFTERAILAGATCTILFANLVSYICHQYRELDRQAKMKSYV